MGSAREAPWTFPLRFPPPPCRERKWGALYRIFAEYSTTASHPIMGTDKPAPEKRKG